MHVANIIYFLSGRLCNSPIHTNLNSNETRKIDSLGYIWPGWGTLRPYIWTGEGYLGIVLNFDNFIACKNMGAWWKLHVVDKTITFLFFFFFYRRKWLVCNVRITLISLICNVYRRLLIILLVFLIYIKKMDMRGDVFQLSPSTTWFMAPKGVGGGGLKTK